MRRFVIAALFALLTLPLAGGLASAQEPPVRLEVTCTGTETVTVTNLADTPLNIVTIGSIDDPYDEEPYAVDVTLMSGETQVFGVGPDAPGIQLGNRASIFDDEFPGEGAEVVTNFGVFDVLCSQGTNIGVGPVFPDDTEADDGEAAETAPLIAPAPVEPVIAPAQVPGKAGRAPAQTPLGDVEETEVLMYQPTGTPRTEVTGSCFASSAAVAREGAWRCSAGNEILDPCFGEPGAEAVLCARDPFSAVTQLNLTQPLPEADADPEQRPWYVELRDGTICGYLTGATSAVAGLRVNYGCTDGSSIIGDIMPGVVWTARLVEEVPPPGSPPPEITSVDVLVVWY